MHQRSRSYNVWYLRYKVQRTKFFVILSHFFAHWPLLTTQKIKILKKLKKNGWRYYHFTLLHHKWQSYDVWFLRYQVWQTEFFVVLGYFFALLPPIYPEYQNFQKMKKIPADIIILHMSTSNQNHMMYDSWDMERDRQNFFSFFCPFTPPPSLTTQRIKVLKKWKKRPGRYHHFTQVYHKWQSYDKLFLRYQLQQIFLSSWAIFCPFAPLTAPEMKI